MVYRLNKATMYHVIVAMNIIKLVLNPVETTDPTSIPAVAIAIPTPTMLMALFCKPITV